MASQQANLSEFNRFLKNNNDYLLQKYLEYFPEPTAPTLANIDIDKVISYICDIFSFDKYKEDQNVYRKIVSSLRQNLENYCKEKDLKEEFTQTLAIDSLSYCIKNNQLFSIQYDVDQNLTKNKQSVGDINVNLNMNAKIMKLNKNTDTSKIGEAELIRQTNIMGQSNLYEEQIGLDDENEFDINEEEDYNNNPEIIKKNAKIVFDLFCKNQMELGGNKTFDRLSEQASTMTIGKLLVYAKAYNLMSSFVTKDIIMHKFKKISNGKRTIDFEKFYILLVELQQQDSTLFSRLELHDQNLWKRIKFVKNPFYTIQKNGRQMVNIRSFHNKLTSHSGKTEEELKQELKLRKNIKNSPFSKISNSKQLNNLSNPEQYLRKQRQKMISPKDLTMAAKSKSKQFSIQLSFIDKIVSSQETDKKWLGHYEVDHSPHQSKKLKDERNVASLHMINRKQSIVQDIRKRIKQLQSRDVRQGKQAKQVWKGHLKKRYQ